MDTTPSLMSIPKFARQCGVRPETARRWIAQGRGPALTLIGKRHKVRSDDYLAWLATHRVGSLPPATTEEPR